MSGDIDGASNMAPGAAGRLASARRRLSDWGHSLDTFNDILPGGAFGTPAAGFVLRHGDRVAQELTAPRARQGPTVFDGLVEITRDHGARGTQADDRVELLLA